MNWSRYSELGLIVAAILLFATAGVAGAVSVSWTNAPEEAAVGEEVSVEAEFTDLYADDEQWQLSGDTALENAAWTIEFYRDGELQSTREVEGDAIDPAIDLDGSQQDAPDRIVITVTGAVPAVESYSYEEPAQFVAVDLPAYDGQSRFTVDTWTMHHYTTGEDPPGSREARTALDDARAAIDQAASDGEDVSDAEATWEDGVAAYDEASFEEAVSLATEAESQLEGDGSGSDDGSTDGGETTDDASEESSDGGEDADAGTDDDGGIGFLTVLMYVLGLAVVVGVVGGVLYLNQQRQGPGGRDPLG